MEIFQLVTGNLILHNYIELLISIGHISYKYKFNKHKFHKSSKFIKIQVAIIKAKNLLCIIYKFIINIIIIN